MASITIKHVTDYLETLAPKSYQEAYDNAGLITGNPTATVTGILVTLDCTEAVVEEARQTGCNLIVAHHPIVFKGLKKLNGSNYVERTVISAIKNDIGLYAIHTNLDNVKEGVNNTIAQKIGLQNLRILAPKRDTLGKLVTFILEDNVEKVLEALHRAGAGQQGAYKNCSFQTTGTGTFLPTAEAKPHIGELEKQEYVKETRIEVLYPLTQEHKIVAALKESHPYEEVAYYLIPITNENQEVGAGIVGELPEALEPVDFLKHLKKSMNLAVIRHTSLLDKPIRSVAVCGGAGSFLLPKAIQSGADAFISADFKYHEFFDADQKIVIADIGHYESEIYTKELLMGVLIKKFSTFAINFSKTVTNPISYF